MSASAVTPSIRISQQVLNNFSAALLCCFLGVTSGVSLGAILFPSSPDHPNSEFKVVGMQLGLVSLVVSNWCLYARSQFYFGVAGGMIAPVIAFSSTYFQKLGPSEANTILFALPVITTLNGIFLFFAAKLPLNQLAKGVPYVVFGGFMAGTGALCVRAGLTIVWSGAETSLMSLLSVEAMPFWFPPLCVSAFVFAAQQLGTPYKDALLSVALLLTIVG